MIVFFVSIHIGFKPFAKGIDNTNTDAMKPAGQWNTYEIIADGDTVTLVINDEEVNQVTGCATNPGSILLTSEGTEIHFRNIEITPLP